MSLCLRVRDKRREKANPYIRDNTDILEKRGNLKQEKNSKHPSNTMAKSEIKTEEILQNEQNLGKQTRTRSMKEQGPWVAHTHALV